MSVSFSGEIDPNVINILETINIDTLIKNKECSVNTKGFNYKGTKAKMYRCKCHPERNIIICEACSKDCHSQHNPVEDDNTPLNYICDCAKSSHITTDKQDRRKAKTFNREMTIKDKNSKCTQMNLVGLVKNSVIYRIDGHDICPFCMVNCGFKQKACQYLCHPTCEKREHYLSPYEVLIDEDSTCECPEVHVSLENSHKLLNFFKSKDRDYCINLIPFINKFLNTRQYFHTYWEIIFSFNFKLLDVILNDKHYNYQKEMNNQYLRTLRLLNELGKCLNQNPIEIKNFKSGEEFSPQRIYQNQPKPKSGFMSLFEMSKKKVVELEKKNDEESFRQVNINSYFCFLDEIFSTLEIKDDVFIKYKIYNLKIFRKFFIMPKIKTLLFQTLQIDYNLNPLHRVIFMKDIKNFFDLTNLKMEGFLKLLNKIANSIGNYFIKVSEEDLNKLIKEYLRYIYILINYKMNKDTVNQILNDVYCVADLISSKKEQFGIIRQLEPIIYALMLINNDEKVYNELFSKSLKDNTYFSFETSDYNSFLIKILFISQIENLDANSLKEVHNGGKSRKFTQKTALLDNLINNQDYYSQFLTSFVNSNSKYYTLENIKIFTSNDHSLYETFMTPIQIEIIRRDINEFDNLKLKYIQMEINDDELYTEILKHLENCWMNIKKEIYGYNLSQDNITNKQLLIFKLGLFDAILSFWQLIKKSVTLTEKFKKTKRYYEIVSNIFKLISLISYQNSFLISLCFNKSVINLFFEKNTHHDEVDEVLLDFYLQNLKYLKKDNYSLELGVLIVRILPCINKWEEKIQKTFKILKIFSYALKINLRKTYEIMTDRICSGVRKLIRGRSFSIFITEMTSDDKKRKDILKREKLPLISKICSILNQVEPQYFFFLNQKNKIRTESISNLSRGKTISVPNTDFNEKSTYSIKDLIEVYIFDINNENPRLHQKLVLTYYKIFLESYTNLEKRNYVNLSIFNEKKERDESFIDNDMISDLVQIDIIKKYLKHFPLVIKTHYKLFTEVRPRLMFDYFFIVAIYPTANFIFKNIMTQDLNQSEKKYEIFTLILLFLQCYELFLKLLIGLIEQNFDVDSINILTLKDNYFTHSGNETILEFLYATLTYVSNKIKEISRDDYHHLNLKNLLEIYTKSTENLIYFDKLKNIKKPEQIITNTLYEKMSSILSDYTEKKGNFESREMLMNRIFEDTTNPKTQQIKSSIFLSLIAKFELSEKNSLTPYTEKNIVILEAVNKIFKADPGQAQNYLVSDKKLIMIIQNMVQTQILYLIQPIEIEFKRLCTDKENNPYKYFLYLIEFLRLMCEDHNANFQTLLFNTTIFQKNENKNSKNYFEMKKKEKLTLLDFVYCYMIDIVENILVLKQKKKDMISFFKSDTNEYFYKVINLMFDFLIEIIQGTYSFNFKKFNVLNPNFQKFFDKMLHAFTQISLGEEVEFILSHFMRFLVAYMEENENPVENKIEILKVIYPKLMYNTFIFAVKKIYIKNFDEKEIQSNYVNYKLPKCASLQLEHLYISNDDLMNDPLFVLSTQIYYFFKLANTINHSSTENYRRIIDGLRESSEKINESKSMMETISEGEIYLFYDKIIKNIEISYNPQQIDKVELQNYSYVFKKSKLSEKFNDIDKIISRTVESTVKNVIFVVHPKCLYITHSDRNKFLEDAPYENFNEKLSYILENIPNFLDIVNMRKHLYTLEKIPFLYKLYNLDYSIFINISVILSLLVNMLLFFNLNTAPSELNLLMSNDIVYYITFFHILALLYLIMNFLTFEIYRLNEFTHKRIEEKEELDKTRKIHNYAVLLTKMEFFPIFWNFTFGFLALLIEEWKWMYSLQLFSVFILFPTMSSVITAVRIRANQFLATSLLIIIIILFYTCISFYMFNDLYYSEELQENLCDSFRSCFLNMLNSGIRSNTIGDFSNLVSINDWYYLSHFIFGWLFFFSVILIMLNIINGIIVDTFQYLREQNNKKNNDNLNICYICNLQRSNFEIVGIDFKKHVEFDHSLNNYLYFLIRIHLIDEHDLNSLESFVLNGVKNNRMDFFPIYKSLSLK